ncbi:Peptidase family M13 [Aphelenchoides bicaudatus]|nr:Peptidase family M13 [Aphelenchoides bicaudatus]
MSSAIAQSPLFDPKMPASISYGGLGFIVGHELTHSFDNDGSKYDEQGRKKEWFDSKSKAEFLKRSDCFVKQYGKLREKGVQKRVNGNKTLGENIADNGGIKAAFRAYQKHLKSKGDKRVPGYSRYTNEQAFFINAGVSFCQAAGESHKSFLLEVDDHSPNIFRINTVLQNFAEFARVFKCRQNTPMNPKNRCSIW